jgi:hypothetical protein
MGGRAPGVEDALTRALHLLEEAADLIEEALYPGVARVRPDPDLAERGLLEGFRHVGDARRAVRNCVGATAPGQAAA